MMRPSQQIRRFVRLFERAKDRPAPLQYGQFPMQVPAVSPASLPSHICRPTYANTGTPIALPLPDLSDPEQRRTHEVGMRASSTAAARLRQFAGSQVKAGVTTEEIDTECFRYCVEELGCYPAPLNYSNFPKSIATSLNEVVCHGIPDSRPLEEGDIINIDVSVVLDGFFGDCSAMFTVGEVDEASRRLIAVTKNSMDAAISICAPNVPVKNIGAVIHSIAESEGYGSVAQFCGHGIGVNFHQAPTVLHVRNNTPEVMRVGETFTIEPMLTETETGLSTWPDEWTILTQDGCRSAQWEETLLVTEKGVEILTIP